MASLSSVASLLMLAASGLAAHTDCIFNGRLYGPLQEIPTNSPCKYCVCSEDTSEPVCFPIQCPAPGCSNPTFKEGHCCAVCPGPRTDCLVDGVTIEAGQSVTMPISRNCYKICLCPKPTAPRSMVQAACTRVCRTS